MKQEYECKEKQGDEEIGHQFTQDISVQSFQGKSSGRWVLDALASHYMRVCRIAKRVFVLIDAHDIG